MMSQVYAIARFHKLDWYWYLPHSMFPLLLLFLMWRLGGQELGRHVFVGWIVALAASGGVGTLPQFVLFYRFIRIQDMFVASPLHPALYFAGVALYALLYALPGWTVLMAIMMGLGVLTSGMIPQVVAALILTWALACAIGFAIATAIKRIAIISAVATLGWLFLGLIPPVYYPVDLIPEGFRWVAWLFPTAHVAQLLRGVLGIADLSPGETLMHWGLAAGVTCLLLVFSTTRSRWRET